jgi:hypothetical protein
LSDHVAQFHSPCKIELASLKAVYAVGQKRFYNWE